MAHRWSTTHAAAAAAAVDGGLLASRTHLIQNRRAKQTESSNHAHFIQVTSAAQKALRDDATLRRDAAARRRLAAASFLVIGACSAMNVRDEEDIIDTEGGWEEEAEETMRSIVFTLLGDSWSEVRREAEKGSSTSSSFPWPCRCHRRQRRQQNWHCRSHCPRRATKLQHGYFLSALIAFLVRAATAAKSPTGGCARVFCEWWQARVRGPFALRARRMRRRRRPPWECC